MKTARRARFCFYPIFDQFFYYPGDFLYFFSHLFFHFQRYIAERIERERIERMQELAMEHMPEAFIPVNMLYIRMMINGHPVIAFVDSGPSFDREKMV